MTIIQLEISSLFSVALVRLKNYLFLFYTYCIYVFLRKLKENFISIVLYLCLLLKTGLCRLVYKCQNFRSPLLALPSSVIFSLPSALAPGAGRRSNDGTLDKARGLPGHCQPLSLPTKLCQGSATTSAESLITFVKPRLLRSRVAVIMPSGTWRVSSSFLRVCHLIQLGSTGT